MSCSFLKGFLQPLYKIFLLENGNTLSLKSFAVAGGLGTGLHVLLDTPLYADITPFYPMTTNSFYNPSLTPKSTAYAFGWEPSE
ncbi:hypothetical protein CW713_01220 [Methanophagales archaeon]|nr:MAG: hypothetical protein CW713_01220 [Methanophagales archaeon]